MAGQNGFWLCQFPPISVHFGKAIVIFGETSFAVTANRTASMFRCSSPDSSDQLAHKTLGWVRRISREIVINVAEAKNVHALAGTDPEFWSMGASGVLTPEGGAWAQNLLKRGGGVPLKIAWKLHDFENILGASGPSPPGPPRSAGWQPCWPKAEEGTFSHLVFSVCSMNANAVHHSGGSRGLGGPAPLAPKISSKSCSFQAILREEPLFWANFGLRAPPGSKICWAPLTKFLDPRLGGVTTSQWRGGSPWNQVQLELGFAILQKFLAFHSYLGSTEAVLVLCVIHIIIVLISAHMKGQETEQGLQGTPKILLHCFSSFSEKYGEDNYPQVELWLQGTTWAMSCPGPVFAWSCSKLLSIVRAT